MHQENCRNMPKSFTIFHAWSPWSYDIKISYKLSQRLFGILRLCPVLEGPLSSMPLQEASPPPSHHAPPSHHHILPGCLHSQGPRDTQCMQNAKQGMGWNAPSMWACLVTDSPIVKLKTRCQDQRLQNVFPSWMKVVVFFALSLSQCLPLAFNIINRGRFFNFCQELDSWWENTGSKRIFRGQGLTLDSQYVLYYSIVIYPIKFPYIMYGYVWY